MKTTIDIPDALYRRTKAFVALRGLTVRRFVIEALEAKLRSDTETSTEAHEPAWMRFAGAAPHGARQQIDAIVDEEFSAVDPEQWK